MHPLGGTRFIGLYLARQLVEQGHDVTLFTRGKKDVTSQIPDDTPDSYANFKASIKHIKGDRMVSIQGHRVPIMRHYGSRAIGHMVHDCHMVLDCHMVHDFLAHQDDEYFVFHCRILMLSKRSYPRRSSRVRNDPVK